MMVAVADLLSAAMAVSCVASTSANLRAGLRPTASRPVMEVNGKPTAPTMHWVIQDHGGIKHAAKHGVDIITFILWGIPWWRDGETPDFSRTDIDSWVDGVLAENPDALLLPRFPVDQPQEWWANEHPDHMMLYAGEDPGNLASIHSLVWRGDAARQVRLLVEHLEEKYGDRIIGYHPCGQSTAEWFYEGMWQGKLSGYEPPALAGFRDFLREKYTNEEGLRHGWHDPDITFNSVHVPSARDRTRSTAGSFRDPVIEQKTIDFDDYQSAAVADTVALMCKAIKEVAPHKLAVAFYGYHFEVVGPRGLQSSGHLGLGRLLRSRDVDVIASPISYVDRQPGGAGCFMGPIDSVLLHGKLGLSEDDTRTHLLPPDAAPGRCADSAETNSAHLRNFSHVLTRGAGVWWSALEGRDEMWSFLGKLHDTYQAAVLDLEPFSPEIAVIVDERSVLYCHPSPAVLATLLGTFRQQWYRIGAPVGMYLLDDLVAGNVPKAKMYIFLDVFRLDDEQVEAIRKRARRRGCTALWMYAPGIVTGDRISPEHVGQVVGLKLRQIDPRNGDLVMEGDGSLYSAGSGLSPTFAPDDPDARVIARYADGGEVAVAEKKQGGLTSVYCGALQLPASVLREIAAQAGVHIYCETDDVVAAGNGFVAVHASSDGHKTLRMPHECSLADAVTGEPLGTGVEFDFEMKQGQTRLLKLGPG